ncbi:MAG TPA: hypothetical protein VHJ76_01610, partial [Actinomycetota bacterium]|nr:hypothetical protein [Actinomycetota bacterium]
MPVGRGFSPDDLSDVVPLLGEKAEPIHMPLGAPEGVGGGDVDCLVWRLDETWPLRLPAGWRLLQILRYDTVAWYWILERGGEVIAIDTLADPDGTGQYAWPVGAETLPLGPGQRASYLTTKRLRKGIRREAEWARIAELARSDPEAFRATLGGPFGGLAGVLADAV